MATSKRGARKASGSRKAEPLAEYHRKRDFEKTAEPAGQAKRRAPRRQQQGGLRFVIQKHAASSLHYDLRLELDGVMRSWAVPKGPSLDPSVKRLAMQVEDHPIEYNTFEGTIPKGEYGGGTVMLWDRGTYMPDEAKPGEDAARAVRRGLAAGKLSFTFHGERLHGSFALVRTDGGERPRWLLIKHRDGQASATADITSEVRTSVATGRTMAEISAEADRVWRSSRGGRRGGEEAGTTAPQSGASMIAPMRPKPARSVPRAGDWTFELWRGGERVLAYVTAETAVLMDEHGADATTSHRAIADELVSLAGRLRRPFVLDGEIAPEGKAASRTRTARKAVEDREVFHVADLLLEGDDVLMDEDWTSRRAALEALLRRRRLKQLALQQIGTDADTFMRRAEREGWPGILARRTDAAYQPGTRSDALRRIPVR
jgi:bifunctional non-homologous end joining protein LigD